jgi:lipoprotein-anchoring transpeptidase ErfK/SrfK
MNEDTIGTLGRRFRRRDLIVGAGVAAGAILLPPSVHSVVAAQQQVQISTGRYFAETGHNLKEPFLSKWQKAGEEKGLGLPLSEERYDDKAGAILQTFEGATLVYDPTLSAPWDIQSQHLSDRRIQETAPASARRKVSTCSGSNCRIFPESGHTISGGLRTFWEQKGDLPIFGLPLSEPFKENGATVQVFERVVLEQKNGAITIRPLGRARAEDDGSFANNQAFWPAPPMGGKTTLVKASDGLRLRTGPSTNAEIQTLLPDNAEFIAVRDAKGDWIPGYADGYSGWVSSDFIKEPPPLPARALKDWNPSVWQGAALGETNLRAEPNTKSEIVKVLQYGDLITVTAWVKGEEVFEGADEWAKTNDGRYIYSRNVGRNAPVMPTPVPSDAPTAGKWIDVHLTQQLMTAYDGRTAVRTVPTTTGMAGWETPPGFYQILSRVPNETMTNGAIGAEHYYKLEDVLFTQYFTNRGHAIHFAWWRTPETIGRPGSHGCLNLLLDDSEFFWNWATIGTPVYVHT